MSLKQNNVYFYNPNLFGGINIKIVIFGTFSDLGGVKNHIRLFCKELAQFEKTELHIVSMADRDDNFCEYGYSVHLIKIPKLLNRTLTDIRCSSLVVDKIMSINPDIVHVHGEYTPYSIVVSDLKKLNLFPVIITIHGLTFEEIKATYRFPLRYFFYLKSINLLYYKRKALKSADKVIAVSEHVRREISKLVPDLSRISVIPNAINLKDDNVGFIEDPSNNSSLHPSMLFLSRLVRLKGCEVLIRSMPIILSSIPDVHLYIAGTGPQLESLKSLSAKLNISNNISFLGYVSETQKFKLYYSTDLYVMTPYLESFGITLLEAMACHKPVIASNVGGICEVIEDGTTGYLFKSGDIDDLAEKCVKMLEDDVLRVKMGHAGRKRVEQLFDSKKVAKNLFDSYVNCLDEYNEKHS